MGKQLGVIQYSGKLGETVGAKKAAGQHSNVIRVRTTTISNPRSTAQAAQRMKMAPAVNFYRALKQILNHSWQGVTYGGASHSKFMKEAMRNQSYPYLKKGITAPVPGAYKISSGSLAPVEVTLNNVAGSLIVETSLSYTENLAGKTIKEISEQLVAQNPQLQMGDQLTFVAAVAEEVPSIEDGYISYRYFRFILSDTDTSVPEDTIITDGNDEITALKINSGYIMVAGNSLGFAISENTDMVVAGAAVIVSRPSVVKNNVTWERSNTTFKVTEPVSEYFSRNYNEVLASYMSNAANVSSDWYLNGGATGATGVPETELVVVTIQKTEGVPADAVTGAGSYEAGSQVTVTAENDMPTWRFVGWKKGGVTVSANARYTFTADSNVTLFAEYEAKVPEEQP